MSAFYDSMAATAVELLAEYGAVGSVERLPEGGTMTAAGDRVVVPEVGACLGIRLGAETTLIEGVEQTATKNLLAPLLVAPEPGDRLLLAGGEGFILRADTMAPDGTVLYHEVWT